MLLKGVVRKKFENTTDFVVKGIICVVCSISLILGGERVGGESEMAASLCMAGKLL